MAVKASSESDEDEQTLRSEKNIPISSTPKFKPFTATVAVENQQKGKTLTQLFVCASFIKTN